MKKEQDWDLKAFREVNALFPTELLYAGPPRYGPMVETAPGRWRTISVSGVAVAIAWTDEKDAFGVIILRNSPVARELRKYPITAKECGIPANWAYEVLDNWSQRQDTPITLGESEAGALSGVWELADLLGSRRATMSSTSVNGMESEDVPEV